VRSAAPRQRRNPLVHYLDAAAEKLRAPRTLTQSISGRLYQLVPPLDGVWFGSRHRGLMLTWAIFEQPHEDDTGSDTLAIHVSVDLTEDTADLVEALRILRLSWTD
jgi:hypothetical protein